MVCLSRYIFTANCFTSLALAIPGLMPRNTLSGNTVLSQTESNIVITTTFSQSTYTYTYGPPTSAISASTSASTSEGWALFPPIIPLPFPVPPVVEPPGVPPTPEEPAVPGEDEGELPTPSLTFPSCSTQTATVCVSNCTESVWVSSNTLQSTLTNCTSSCSTTSGCTAIPSTSTVTMHGNEPVSTADPTETIFSYQAGQVYIEKVPLDDPTKVADIFATEFGIDPAEDEVSPGNLTCAPQPANNQGFIQDNALGNVMDFCSGGISITGNGKSKNYTQPTGGIELAISTTYQVSDTCPSGDSVSWDEDRCKYLLNRPIFECEPGNSNTQTPKNGGSVLADCLLASLSPSSLENVVCGTNGAWDNGSGKGNPNFNSTDASDAITKYCNGDENYVSDPTSKSTVNGVEMIGLAQDRFWYKNGLYCETTRPHPAVGGLPQAKAKDCRSMNDYEIDVGVKFKTDQTGCQPAQKFNVPKGDECVNTLTKVISSCSPNQSFVSGGKVDDDSGSGCLEWWLYASGSTF